MNRSYHHDKYWNLGTGMQSLYGEEAARKRAVASKSRHHLPEIEPDDFYRPHYVSGEGMLPTIILMFVMFLLLITGITSFGLTKETSPDGSHIHWTLFGKYLINEDGHIKSHHYGHPEKCAICKRIFAEMADKSR